MIYCVEDDSAIRELIVYTLINTGFEAQGFESGRELYNAIKLKQPELILLDIMLPEEDGISILKKLRCQSITKSTPIIMLTAKITEYDKVIGLDNGADDYISKPFGMMEFISRVKAVLRRSNAKQEPSILRVGKVEINTKAHTVTVDGKIITLALKEFELLYMLMKSPGIVLTRDVLLEKIWEYDFDGETRTVDVHVRTLRQKMGKEGDAIETVRGVGYRIGNSHS